MRSGRWQRRWLGMAGLAGFLALLEVVPRAGLVPDRYLPPTSRIAGALAGELGQPGFWAALIPLAVLLFGTDLRSKLLLVVYASFWQVLIQVLHGTQDVDPVAMDTAHSYRLGRWARIRHVVWPTTLPYAVTGFRLAASVALVLAITAELIIGSPGLGKEIAVAQTSGAVPAMYALVVVTGLLGVGVNLLARALERRVLAWHPSTRREAAA